MIPLVTARYRVQQHVGRLDVPVHQPVQMSRVERQRHLRDDPDGPVRGKRSFGIDQAAYVAALHVSHRDEQHAVALPRSEDRNDVRVVDGRRRPGLTNEALPERIVQGEHGREQFKGDVAAQLDIAGAVDDRHPAPADLLLQPVASDLRSDFETGRILVFPPGHSALRTSLVAGAAAAFAPPG